MAKVPRLAVEVEAKRFAVGVGALRLRAACGGAEPALSGAEGLRANGRIVVVVVVGVAVGVAVGVGVAVAVVVLRCRTPPAPATGHPLRARSAPRAG